PACPKIPNPGEKCGLVHRVEIATTARRDIARVLRNSEKEFGTSARDRYKALLDQAIGDLAEDSARPGTRHIDEIRKGYCVYHLKFSRNRVTGKRVGKPRHFLMYRHGNGGALIIARLLHERMLPQRHPTE
ncbi:MAG: type II toxin-antitoxin system RelE/ParE family toxin, partial [Gammaproteobacteria bacterium]